MASFTPWLPARATGSSARRARSSAIPDRRRPAAPRPGPWEQPAPRACGAPWRCRRSSDRRAPRSPGSRRPARRPGSPRRSPRRCAGPDDRWPREARRRATVRSRPAGSARQPPAAARTDCAPPPARSAPRSARGPVRPAPRPPGCGLVPGTWAAGRRAPWRRWGARSLPGPAGAVRARRAAAAPAARGCARPPAPAQNPKRRSRTRARKGRSPGLPATVPAPLRRLPQGTAPASAARAPPRRPAPAHGSHRREGPRTPLPRTAEACRRPPAPADERARSVRRWRAGAWPPRQTHSPPPRARCAGPPRSRTTSAPWARRHERPHEQGCWAGSALPRGTSNMRAARRKPDGSPANVRQGRGAPRPRVQRARSVDTLDGAPQYSVENSRPGGAANMSNTRDNGDADSAVPIGLEVTEQTVPLTEDSTWQAMSDMAATLAGAGDEQGDDDDLLARDARAALAAGDAARAAALECARAL